MPIGPFPMTVDFVEITSAIVINNKIIFVFSKSRAENLIKSIRSALTSTSSNCQFCRAVWLCPAGAIWCFWIRIMNERSWLQRFFKQCYICFWHQVFIYEELPVGRTKRDQVLIRVPSNVNDIRVIVSVSVNTVSSVSGIYYLERIFCVRVSQRRSLRSDPALKSRAPLGDQASDVI